jgi:hypothetical protein
VIILDYLEAINLCVLCVLCGSFQLVSRSERVATASRNVSYNIFYPPNPREPIILHVYKEDYNNTNKSQLKLTEVKGDIKTLDSKFDDMNKRLEKVEGTQKNQIWTLITVLSGSLLGVGFRSFFIDNNP